MAIFGRGYPIKSAVHIGKRIAAAPTSPWTIVAATAPIEITGTTTHTLGLTASAAAGDLLIAVISSRVASTTPITLPTGGEWTLVTQQCNNNVIAGASNSRSSGMMAYCVRGASNPNLTFTHPVAVDVAVGNITTYRNNKLTSPTDGNSSTTMTTGTMSVVVTGVTTSAANDLIVIGGCSARLGSFNTFNATDPGVASGAVNTSIAPQVGAWTHRVDYSTAAGADTALGVADAVKGTAGATGNITASVGSTGEHVILVGAFKVVGAVSAYSLAANAGSYTLTGASTTNVRRGRVDVAGGGTYTLTGTAAGLTKSANKTLVAGTSTYTLTGASTTNVRRGRLATAGNATYTLTGASTTNLRRGRVDIAGSGTYTLTGASTTNVRRGRLVTAGNATYTLTGTAAGLSKSAFKTLTAQAGTYTLTGASTTNLRRGRVDIAGSGTYTLTGASTTNIRRGRLVTAGNATYALTGSAASLTKAAALPQVLLPELYDDPDTFFGATISYTQFLQPALYVDPDIFFASYVEVFYENTEIICVGYEDRRMGVTSEYRLMWGLEELRGMEVNDTETAMTASPRRREC